MEYHSSYSLGDLNKGHYGALYDSMDPDGMTPITQISQIGEWPVPLHICTFTVQQYLGRLKESSSRACIG